MERTLVIGATGQLGRAVIAKLLPHRIAVRALVRNPEAAAELQALGVEPVRGDLTDPDSLKRACHDIATIVATATSAVPTRPIKSGSCRISSNVATAPAARSIPPCPGGQWLPP